MTVLGFFCFFFEREDGWMGPFKGQNTTEMPKMLGECCAAAHSLAATQPNRGPQTRLPLFDLRAAGQTGVGLQLQVFDSASIRLLKAATFAQNFSFFAEKVYEQWQEGEAHALTPATWTCVRVCVWVCEFAAAGPAGRVLLLPPSLQSWCRLVFPNRDATRTTVFNLSTLCRVDVSIQAQWLYEKKWIKIVV